MSPPHRRFPRSNAAILYSDFFTMPSASLLLAFIAAVWWLYWTARSPLPQLDGSVAVPGISSQVTYRPGRTWHSHYRSSDARRFIFRAGIRHCQGSALADGRHASRCCRRTLRNNRPRHHKNGSRGTNPRAQRCCRSSRDEISPPVIAPTSTRTLAE